jgi:hypothetical protein
MNMQNLVDALCVFTKYEINPKFQIVHDEIHVYVSPEDVDASDILMLTECGFEADYDWCRFYSTRYR